MLAEFLPVYNSGFTVTSVSNSSDALKAIALMRYDIYLIDNWLSGDSGTKLCREIRLADPVTPIIMYSGLAYRSDMEQGLDAGVDAYLTKPNDLMELGPVIDKLLATRRESSQTYKPLQMSAF
jgi:DNA-binding response OmpR family regulator